MKKVFFIVLLVLVSHNAIAADRINCGTIYSGTIAASGTATIYVSKGSEGFFSIQPVFTGSGTLKIQYQVSNDIDKKEETRTWSPAVDIVTSATSGTIYSYPASGTSIFSGSQRIVLTETSTTDSVVISGVYRCVQ